LPFLKIIGIPVAQKGYPDEEPFALVRSEGRIFSSVRPPVAILYSQKIKALFWNFSVEPSS